MRLGYRCQAMGYLTKSINWIESLTYSLYSLTIAKMLPWVSRKLYSSSLAGGPSLIKSSLIYSNLLPNVKSLKNLVWILIMQWISQHPSHHQNNSIPKAIYKIKLLVNNYRKMLSMAIKCLKFSNFNCWWSLYALIYPKKLSLKYS